MFIRCLDWRIMWPGSNIVLVPFNVQCIDTLWSTTRIYHWCWWTSICHHSFVKNSSPVHFCLISKKTDRFSLLVKEGDAWNFGHFRANIQFSFFFLKTDSTVSYIHVEKVSELYDAFNCKKNSSRLSWIRAVVFHVKCHNPQFLRRISVKPSHCQSI